MPIPQAHSISAIPERHVAAISGYCHVRSHTHTQKKSTEKSHTHTRARIEHSQTNRHTDRQMGSEH